MLKKRIVGLVVAKGGLVVQSIKFSEYLPVGKPEIAFEFLNNWGIDEIIYTEIENQDEPNYDLIKKSTSKCFVPLTVGGNISKISHIEKLMKSGVDKISINSAAIDNSNLIKKSSKIFGNQCIVVSIDISNVDGNYLIYNNRQRKVIDLNLDDYVKKVCDEGAGEILINSVELDGTYKGYDIDLAKKICNLTDIPVIFAGGAKSAKDFEKIFNLTNVAAAAAGNFFHFTEHSVIKSKSYLRDKIKIRINDRVNYKENIFDDRLRLAKKDDEILDDMLFIKIDDEII